MHSLNTNEAGNATINTILQKESLTQEQQDAIEIANLPKDQLDALLALSPEEIDQGYPGFLSGDRLRNCFNEKNFLPLPELMDAALYAGLGDFEGLQKYVYDHIENLSVTLGADTTPIPLENIKNALGIVEEFMEKDKRRTGEPGIAHIYRTILRTTEIIDYYNDLHNSEGTNTRITPEIAGVMYLSAILHDFVEDRMQEDNRRIQIGQAYAHYQDDPEKTGLFLIRKLFRRGFKFDKNVDKGIFLPIDEDRLRYLENALVALNSNDVEPQSIIQHLLQHVYKEYSNIFLLDTDQDTLASVPIFVKTADREDNLSTYGFQLNRQGKYECTNVEKSVSKAQENLTLFNNAEWHMLTDGPKLFSSRDIYPLPNDEEEEDKSDLRPSPSSEPFFPSRWAKLKLLGLSPNQMYRIPEGGGLPQLI